MAVETGYFEKISNQAVEYITQESTPSEESIFLKAQWSLCRCPV